MSSHARPRPALRGLQLRLSGLRLVRSDVSEEAASIGPILLHALTRFLDPLGPEFAHRG